MKKKCGKKICAGLAGALGTGYVFSIKGRRKNRRMVEFQHQLYAHRGLHSLPEAPENSMEAFNRAYEEDYGIEIDVHLLKDGSVAVFHDSKLERVCGVKGVIEDLTYEEASTLRLQNTEEHIPLLTELLCAHKYKRPFLIEIKTYKNNGNELTKKVCEILDGFPDITFCIQSFDPRVLLWLRKHRPEIIRGQLSSDFVQERAEELTQVSSFLLTFLLTNALTRPDFISYNFHYRRNMSVRICKTFWHLPVFNWTIRTREDMITAQMAGNTVIFEGFHPRR